MSLIQVYTPNYKMTSTEKTTVKVYLHLTSCISCDMLLDDDDETCMVGNDTICLKCYENKYDNDDYSDPDDDKCECSFPKFNIKDGIQSCSICNKRDHYKCGIVDDHSDDDDDEYHYDCGCNTRYEPDSYLMTKGDAEADICQTCYEKKSNNEFMDWICTNTE